MPKSSKPPPLVIAFEYDSIADVFIGELPNRARFAFQRDEVSGKLKSNLDLYRRAVLRLDEPERPEPPTGFDWESLRDAYLQRNLPTKVGVIKGKPLPEGYELDLDNL